MSLSAFPALVLNADYRPLSVFPLSLKNAEEAIRNVYEDTVTVVKNYDRIIRSPTVEMFVPSVVALRQYVRKGERVPFTRHNVYLRDRFKCQYCGDGDVDLTFDHVVPRSKGGGTNWTNIVAACPTCNSLKGSRTDMQPMKIPREPTMQELKALRRFLLPKNLHPTWLEFLPADLLAA